MDLKETLLISLTTQLIKYGGGICSQFESMRQYWLPGIRKELSSGVVSFPFSASTHSQVGQKKTETASAEVNCVVQHQKNSLMEKHLIHDYFSIL